MQNLHPKQLSRKAAATECNKTIKLASIQSSDKCLGCSAQTAVISKTLLLSKIRHLNLCLSSLDCV